MFAERQLAINLSANAYTALDVEGHEVIAEGRKKAPDSQQGLDATFSEEGQQRGEPLQCCCCYFF
ncbi:MAG TPA: hypothetical protein VE934_09485 [Polaromonas sp.]|uniref:hypothetical protein n=1 Tax=Polaromonas sp. TaxID=1869339 RepID=UPI002D64E170|nr:hypothetical protein [Polaromonas sp.]HYW57182.1 hypothetical protein [Polaromonas sp.]